MKQFRPTRNQAADMHAPDLTAAPTPATRATPAVKPPEAGKGSSAAGTGVGRRGFLKLGGGMAAAAGLMATAPTLGAAGASPILSTLAGRARARNLIFLVSDGMSYGTLTLADHVIRAREGRASHWFDLLSKPGVRRSLQMTHSANSLVTDSAAAASAWGIGLKTDNNAVCITPDGKHHTPLLVQARQNGLATGLVTTTRVTHATPASFIANVPRRNMEAEIAGQMLARKCDVVLGGGARHFPSEALGAERDLTVVRTAAELRQFAGNGNGRLMGLFREDHMSYEIDRGEEEPTLAEMTRAALERLSRHGEGFVVQIEGGRVDHAAHDNDVAGLLYDQIAFDEALGAVMDFTRDRDDTLVIVTTDHGNANPGLTHPGRVSERGINRLLSARQSVTWIVEQVTQAVDAHRLETARTAAMQALNVEFDDAETELLRRCLDGERVHPVRTQNGLAHVLGALLANYTAVAFMSHTHTSDLCEVTAYGPGSEGLAPTCDNTDLHTLALRALALTAADD